MSFLDPPSISRVTSCKDKTVYATKCGGWANNGECAGKNKEWMLENCCESCKKGIYFLGKNYHIWNCLDHNALVLSSFLPLFFTELSTWL